MEMLGPEQENRAGTLLVFLENSQTKEACSHLETHCFVNGLLVTGFYSPQLPTEISAGFLGTKDGYHCITYMTLDSAVLFKRTIFSETDTNILTHLYKHPNMCSQGLQCFANFLDSKLSFINKVPIDGCVQWPLDSSALWGFPSMFSGISLLEALHTSITVLTNPTSQNT